MRPVLCYYMAQMEEGRAMPKKFDVDCNPRYVRDHSSPDSYVSFVYDTLGSKFSNTVPRTVIGLPIRIEFITMKDLAITLY